MAWTEKDPNGTYRGRYKDPFERNQTALKGATSKRAALKAAQDEEAKIRDGRWIDPAAGRMTFSEYVETIWLPNKVGEKRTVGNYQSTYRAHLKPEFGHMMLKVIRHSHVQGWVSRMEKRGDDPNSIGCRFRALQTILAGPRGKGSSAIRDKLIQSNPCEGVQLPHVPEREVEIFTPAEIDDLTEVVDGWWQLIPILGSQTEPGGAS